MIRPVVVIACLVVASCAQVARNPVTGEVIELTPVQSYCLSEGRQLLRLGSDVLFSSVEWPWGERAGYIARATAEEVCRDALLRLRE